MIPLLEISETELLSRRRHRTARVPSPPDFGIEHRCVWPPRLESYPLSYLLPPTTGRKFDVLSGNQIWGRCWLQIQRSFRTSHQRTRTQRLFLSLSCDKKIKTSTRSLGIPLGTCQAVKVQKAQRILYYPTVYE